MNSKQVRIGSCVYADNMNTMVRFYRDVLGLETDWDGGDFAEFFTASGRLSFFMYSAKAFAEAIGENYTPSAGINLTFEIALWLPCYADVDAEYSRLSELDVKFPTSGPITYPFGIRNFYVADPEGNLIEIGSTEKE